MRAFVLTITSFLFGSALAARAQSLDDYTRLETPNAYVFMDRNGVAFRLKKVRECRNVDWAPGATPMLLATAEDYGQFKAAHEAAGDWQSWTCIERPSEVTFSRDIQRTQRALNASATKPACAPVVPETGRYNWEMLEFTRCTLEEKAIAARSIYKADFAFRLATLLGEPIVEDDVRRDAGAIIARLSNSAKAETLVKPDPSCGEDARTIFDLAVCRMAARDRLLTQMENAYAWYRTRVADLQGRELIASEVASSIAMDAAEIQRLLTLAERASMETQEQTP